MTLKKTLLIGLVGTLALPSLAQKMNLTAAILEFKNRKNTVKAKENIDSALEKLNDGGTLKSKDLDKFWYYRGLIYTDYFSTDSSDVIIETAAESFNKVIELNSSSYSKSAQHNIAVSASRLLNKAYKLSDNEDYNGSVAVFDKYFKLNEYRNYTDTNNIYYSSVMALNGKDYNKAIELNNTLIGIDPLNESYHINKLKAYKGLGDSDAYEKAISESKSQCIGCKEVILDEVNFYLQSGETDKLLKSLNTAIEADPTNAILHYAKGTTIGESNPEDAKVEYLKAIELDPNFADVYVNLSGLYMSQANEIIGKINNLGISQADNIKAEQYSKEKDAIFQEAKPYLEKSVELDDKNPSIMNALMTIYYQLGETDKWKETKAKYDALKK